MGKPHGPTAMEQDWSAEFLDSLAVRLFLLRVERAMFYWRPLMMFETGTSRGCVRRNVSEPGGLPQSHAQAAIRSRRWNIR